MLHPTDPVRSFLTGASQRLEIPLSGTKNLALYPETMERIDVSNFDNLCVWVSDLDGYINIDAISRANDRQAEEEAEFEALEDIGNISLFYGRAISATLLNDRQISSAEWHWAVHQAENVLHSCSSWSELEPLVVKDLLSLGKLYAVARYAKWENISFHTALTATFPYGIKALLDQFLSSQEGILKTTDMGSFRASFTSILAEADLLAYDRTGMVQSEIHQAANTYALKNFIWGARPYQKLPKEGMRKILSLVRLHFSVREIDVKSLRELRDIDRRYEKSRIRTQNDTASRSSYACQKIKNWELRHLYSLTYFHPFSIRHAIARGLQQLDTTTEPPNRNMAVNELALVRCSLMLMKQKAKRNCPGCF